MPLHPLIVPAIFALRPDFAALSLAVAGGANRASNLPLSVSLARGLLAPGAAILDQARPEGRHIALES